MCIRYTIDIEGSSPAKEQQIAMYTRQVSEFVAEQKTTTGRAWVLAWIGEMDARDALLELTGSALIGGE